MALNPVVKIVDFAKERDSSIDKMISQMENQKSSHKRIFQRLPKHLRRRAMSYDVKKIPSDMRPLVEKQVNEAYNAKAANKPGGRDPNKYRKHGQNLAIHRNQEYKWLESHLWHSKRFHMTNLWGWKIPFAPTMKQTRNLVKMTKENCTMRDISYMDIISLSIHLEENNSANTRELLNTAIVSLLKPHSRIENRNHILFPAELFQQISPSIESIGPVHLFWVDDNQLWIICHTLLSSKVQEALTPFEESIHLAIELIQGELNIFEIYGPNATNAIRTVLNPNTTETPPELLQIIATLPPPSCVPPGTSIAFTACDPRTINEHAETCNPSPSAFDFNSLTMPNVCESRLFKDRSFELKSEQEFNAERAKLLFPKAEGPSGSIPVILMQQFVLPGGFSSTSAGFGSSWLIILPFGCGDVVFRKFVHRGVRIFGLECSKLIDLESGQFNFPFDRPDTPDGFQIIQNECNDLNAQNNARPIGKRKNLNFYAFPDNFFIAFSESLYDLENAYLRVGLIMLKRGTPSRFSTIYIPEPEDYGIVTASQANKDVLIQELKGERKPIGMVLNGNSSLLAGDGRGIGIIQALAMSHFLPEAEIENGFRFPQRPKDSKLAVVREQGSQFLHLAWVWIHPSNSYP